MRSVVRRAAKCSLARARAAQVQRRVAAVIPTRAYSSSTSGTRRADESLEDELHRLADYKQTSVSLKATLETGLGLLLPADGNESKFSQQQRTLIQIASFLRRELPVRLARRVIELQQLPEGLHSMPSVQRVREWYEQSFAEIRRSRPPVDMESEAAFHDILTNVYERHAPTLTTMARGVYELRQQLVESGKMGREEFGEIASIHDFLDRFYMSRIGIRILIGQYLALRRDEQPDDYVGLIHLQTSPAEITEQAIEDATYLCERAHGDAPEVVIKGRTDLKFAYVPSHLYYCMFELLKNSLRATCEFHDPGKRMPNINVVIADSEQNEDIVIKISDEGGGVPRSQMPRIWSYLFTTATPAFGGDDESLFSEDHSTRGDPPLAGLGYGLPISRSYARYFGGDLNLMSMEGYGLDAFMHLPRLGDRDEPLH
jgi:pyruvate dehydrogenase kinase 2/3/4